MPHTGLILRGFNATGIDPQRSFHTDRNWLDLGRLRRTAVCPGRLSVTNSVADSSSEVREKDVKFAVFGTMDGVGLADFMSSVPSNMASRAKIIGMSK